MRLDGIDYEFEKHHISNPPNETPPGWVYLIKPPNACWGGLDESNPTEQAKIDDLLAAGYTKVSSSIYDEFLRSMRIKAGRAGKLAEHVQLRFDIIRAREAVGLINRDQFTWGEWEEHTPSCWGWGGDLDRYSYLKLVEAFKGHQ